MRYVPLTVAAGRGLLFGLALVALEPTEAAAGDDSGAQAACLKKEAGDPCADGNGIGGTCTPDPAVPGVLACRMGGGSGGGPGSGGSKGVAGSGGAPGGSGSGATAGYGTGEGGSVGGLACSVGTMRGGGSSRFWQLSAIGGAALLAYLRSVRRKSS